MKRFSDESGWVRVVVCFATLLAHHGLRDALITGLPTLAAADPPTIPSTSTSAATPTTTTYLSSSTQGNEAYVESVFTTRSSNLTFSSTHPTNFILRNRKQLEETSQRQHIFTVTHTPLLSHSVVGAEQESSDASIYSLPTAAPSLAGSHERWDKTDLTEGHDQSSGINNLRLGIPLLKQEVGRTNNEVDGNMLEMDSTSDSVGNILFLPPFLAFRGGRAISLPLESVKDRTFTHQREKHLDGRRAYIYKTMVEDRSAAYKFKRDVRGRVKFRGRKIVIGASSSPAQWHSTKEWDSRREGDRGLKEADSEGRKVQSFSLEGHQFKEEWSLVIEGVVLSSVYWGWLFAALLADPLIDRVGVRVVLSVSVGVVGLLGLLTHAASLGGPWTLLGFRVVQGTVQGVSYPAVVRVLEGIPAAARASAALLVFLGPSLGTGLGAGLASLPQWYVATYVVGSLAVVLTPLCLLLPPQPDAAPHKMLWKRVLSCRGVWACVGVHVANTWMLHTLLVGLPLCLTYTNLQQSSASGWVVTVAAVAVCAVVRLHLFLASKLTGKRPSSALNRRRIPVVAGTVMVTAAVIVMATAGLDSAEVLVGVGVGLAGFGVGVARVGYRLNVDDMAPLGAWRVTKILDAAAVVTAALSPVVVTALAQAGSSGWVGVWLVPLAALLPTAAIHLFLLTSNSQSWDQTGKSTGTGENGAPGGEAVPTNGVAPPLSSSRQSFKSARSALTFKTARSRSRTRTLSCRTIDDDLEGDMYSVANSNMDCRSVVDEADQECVSVASSSTFKSDGADMHSVVDGVDGTVAPGKRPGQQFGSMLVNGGTADRTSVWLSSHHDLVLETGSDHTSTTRADAHATNAIYGLLW